MLRWPHLARPLAALSLLALAFPALADQPAARKAAADKQAPGKFVRLQRDAKGRPTALQTAVVRYRPASGEGDLVVDLVSVVHIADRDYYDKLNEQFKDYDVVLYELVAPEGTRIPRGGRKSDNPLAFLQQMATQALDLDSQTDCIDYTCKNFVHADLSPEGMARAIRERGEDGFTLFLSITADFLRQQNVEARKAAKRPAAEEPELDLLTLLFDPKGPTKLKRAFAEQLGGMESPESGLPQTLNTILVTDRNKACMKVFQAELARGKKKIAIFYGAAHMPDFEKRLKADFGLKRVSEQWLTAWDLREGR